MSEQITAAALDNLPGVKVNNIVVNKIGEITFPNARSSEPLQPLVQAFYDANDEILQVSAIVYIDEQANVQPNDLIVSMEKNKRTNKPAEFYINYDASELGSKSFQGFQVDFEVPFNKQPKEIVCYVNDLDPRTSKQTEVDVQP